jgi:hypothetical protein
MRSARKARPATTSRRPAGQPTPGRALAPDGLRPAWYLPDTAKLESNPADEDLHDMVDGVFGPGSIPDEHTVAAAIRLAAASVSHVTSVVSSGQARLSPELLIDLLAGLNVAQAHIVQVAEHLARQIRRQTPLVSTAMPAAKTELLADMLVEAGDRGQLAAAHLNEARLLLDVG